MTTRAWFTALSIVGATSPAIAAGTEGWSRLDQELAALQDARAKASTGDGSPAVHGFVRTNYAYSSDIFLDLNGNGIQESGEHDLGGFSLDNARLRINGAVDEFNYEVSFDFGGLTPGSTLIDAYASTNLNEYARFTMGQFRAPFLRSALVPETRTLMIARTRNGIFYSVRGLGAMLDGTYESLHWSVADQNGVDGRGNDALYSARVELGLLGGGTSNIEGAYGAGQDAKLTLGGGWSDDAGLTGGGTALAFDANFTMGGLFLQGEIVDYDKGYTSALLFPGEPRGDTTPYSLTASYMLVPDQWEVGLRYEDFDEDTLDRKLWTAGVNRYVQGHDIKWQLNYAHADTAAVNIDTFALGLTVAF